MSASGRLPTSAVVMYAVVALVLAVLLLVGFASGCKAWGRYQSRADAGNRVKVSAILIRNQAQRVKIARQSARIKHERAIGQRLANHEIASRLTPLFVQYEMISVLQQIAASGRNNSVVYIPSGANGVPLVSVSGQPQVYQGDAQAKK